MVEKPRIVVFDDEAKYRIEVIERLLRGKIDIIRIDYFTRESLKKGETGVAVDPSRVLKLDPAAIVVDLVLFPTEKDWTRGLELLRVLYGGDDVNKRTMMASLTKEVLIVSSQLEESNWGYKRNIKSLQECFGLKVRRFFWNDLVESYNNEAKEGFISAINDAVRARQEIRRN